MTAPRVLVTGATGFLGRHCLDPLQARGFEVHAVSHRRPPEGEVIWHTGDLLDPNDRKRVIDEAAPSHLVHAAWYLEPGVYAASPLNVDWVVASLDLIRLFAATGGERAVGIGSCFEYGFNHPILEESAKLDPVTIYGACKQAVGIAGATLARAMGLSFAWARPFFLYGPHEDRRRLIPDIVASLLAGRDVATSEGLQRRDYMFVEDAGDAIAALIDSTVEGPVNIATGDAPAVRDLVTIFGERIGRLDLIQFGARPSAAGDPAEIRADITRLRHEVGWARITPPSLAAERTVDWWRAAMRVSR